MYASVVLITHVTFTEKILMYQSNREKAIFYQGRLYQNFYDRLLIHLQKLNFNEVKFKSEHPHNWYASQTYWNKQEKQGVQY